MMQLYHQTCQACSKLITQSYSTSFSLGIKTLARRFRDPIYAIYGFVRYADEIVDTFHDYDKRHLLATFQSDAFAAIEAGISLNPVLHTFQEVVRAYGIEHELIEAFLRSMEMDLHEHSYDRGGYADYIYGSAEVVGLMCLRVFCEGDETRYRELEAPARSLGRAFQKVNFLRDLKSDFFDRGRVYFPGVDFAQFDNSAKAAIEADIARDFEHAYQGIMALPEGARQGVYLAYAYYRRLFSKIQSLPAARIKQKRIRVPNQQKFAILLRTYLQHQLNLL
ncbi:MAG: phytoene/squalene synthase family protein [Bacteroidetes bacterium]|nr:MAG: phytoene/squalene synthase family protein [Bacteroidota bacterium]